MPKRGNGKGSLQQRGEKWLARYTLGRDEQGRQRRLARSFERLEDAQAWLEQHHRREQPGQPEALVNLHADALTFRAFLLEWLAVKKHQVRDKTWQDYERVVRVHLSASSLGEVPLGALTPLHVERLLLALLTAGKSPTLAFVVLRVVKLALRQAVDWGVLAFSPAARVKAPRRQRHEMRVWTPQQVQQFLSCCQKHQPRLYALFYLALTTGLRRGELLGLHWNDVDEESGELFVRWNLVQCGSKAVLSEPKTAASRRRVLLSPDTLAVLREHRERQQGERRRWKPRGSQEEGLVFPSTVGRFQLPCTLVRLFHQLVGLAEVPNIRFHDLRHTAASLLVQRGVPIKAIAERLGHSDASLTLRVYTHVYDEQRREAALPLNELLEATR